MVPLSNHVCIGLNVAWWGGQGRGNPASSADFLLGNQVGSLKPYRQLVDLRSAPNPLAEDHCQPNFDANADVTIAALRKEIARLEEASATGFILAVDAPLMTAQSGQSPRRRVAKKGDKGGVSYRSCETRFVENVRARGGPFRRVVNIQPGAPLPPRVGRLSERLTGELGFTYLTTFTEGETLPPRVLLEVYPFEAIWALGVAGYYGGNEPDWVTTYKKLERCIVSRGDAMEWARRPLRAFIPLLADVIDVTAAIDTVAHWACESRTSDDSFKVTRRYEVLVDAALVWLTALAFRHGKYHVFRDADEDGALIGPGTLLSS